jgi:hypothetical protein
MKKKGWQGHINIHYIDTGERVRVKNAILDGGLTLTSELWLGLTSETFEELQIEGAGAGEELAKTLNGSYAVNAGEAVVTSTVVFTGSEISFDVTTVALIGSLGTRIAEATVNIPTGSAVEITREDTLTEVTP